MFVLVSSAMSLLCIQIADCSEVMHGGIPSDLSRADGFAEVHLAEVFEESVVYNTSLGMAWDWYGLPGWQRHTQLERRCLCSSVFSQSHCAQDVLIIRGMFFEEVHDARSKLVGRETSFTLVP